MNRWHLVCLMLRSPDRVSRRLARLLARWPAAVRRHCIGETVRDERMVLLPAAEHASAKYRAWTMDAA